MSRARRGGGRWRWAHRGTAILFLGLLLLGARAWFPWFKGSTTATTLVNTVPFADPLAALEVILSSRILEPDLVIGALIVAAAAVILGPLFCGWACPFGLVLELAAGARARLLRRGFSCTSTLTRGGAPRVTRYLFLGLALGFSLAATMPAFQVVSPINLVSWLLVFFPLPALGSAVGGAAGMVPETGRALFHTTLAAGGSFLLIPAAILAAELFFPRLFCRAICPLGALYSLLGLKAPLRVRSRAGAPPCPPPCRECTLHCPLGLPAADTFHAAAARGLEDPACTRCGECLDACPRRKLRLGFAQGPETDRASENAPAPEERPP